MSLFDRCRGRWFRFRSRRRDGGRAASDRASLPAADRPFVGLEPLEPRILLSATLHGLDDADEQNQAQQAIELLESSPALFIENQGQWEDASVRFVHEGDGAHVAITDSGPVFHLFRPSESEAAAGEGDDVTANVFGLDRDREPVEMETRQFAASFVDADLVTPVGLEPSASRFNYFVGDESSWRGDVPAFEIVAYEGLYEGIDLHTFGQRSNLKYEFLVAPGADPAPIAVTYAGIEGLSINDAGELVVDLGDGWAPVVDAAPYVYQEIDGEQVEVESRYVLIDDQTYGFELGEYDPNHELVIDPELAWSTYLGGSNVDWGRGIAVDSSGNVLVTGGTTSSGWTSGGFDTSFNGSWDAFVVKLSTTGEHVWSTYLGGSSVDWGSGIAVDSSGNVLVTGETRSSGWTSGGFDTSFSGNSDAFVAKLSGSGEHLWSTYLSGLDGDWGSDIAVDSLGDVLVTGSTPPAALTSGGPIGRDAVVVKLRATGEYVWSTYLGGSGNEFGSGIAVDSLNNVLVTGWTQSPGWTSGGFDTSYNGNGDAFVAKLSGSGDHLWSTYLGGSGGDVGYGIAVDSANNALVTGNTWSQDFAGANNSYPGGWDSGFVSKVSGSGSLVWSIYLGGSGDWDPGHGIAVDVDGNAWVTGETVSTNFAGANNSYPGGTVSGFVAKVTGSGTLVGATYLGGSGWDGSYGIAVDVDGNAWVTGDTNSTNFAGANSSYPGGSYSAFVAKIVDGDGTPVEPEVPQNIVHPRVASNLIDEVDNIWQNNLVWLEPDDPHWEGVLIVRSQEELNGDPDFGITYAPGTSLHNGHVLYAGNESSFSYPTVLAGIDFMYTAFSYNSEHEYSEGVTFTPMVQQASNSIYGASHWPTDSDPELPSAAPGAASLTLVTHGMWASADTWVTTIAQEIASYAIFTQKAHTSDFWTYDWSDDASEQNAGFANILTRAETHGERLGQALESYGYEHIHLIAHSAGSMLIDTAVSVLADAGVEIHATFLDAYHGLGVEPYGEDADWAEQYYTDRILGPGTASPGARNFEISGLGSKSHSFPHEWYLNSIRHLNAGGSPVAPMFQGLGFNTSLAVDGIMANHGLPSWSWYGHESMAKGVDTALSFLRNASFTAGLDGWDSHGAGTVDVVEAPRDPDGYIALMTTASPVTLSQEVATPGQPVELTFDYEFLTATGDFEVVLDSVVLATLEAPGELADERSTFVMEVSDPDLLGLNTATLAFRLDGLAGSQVGITNVKLVASDQQPPTAEGDVADISNPTTDDHVFTVTYQDNVALDISTIVDNDEAVRVFGPNGFEADAVFVGIDDDTDGTRRVATYRIGAPDGGWWLEHNGTYTVHLRPNQVADVAGNFADGHRLATFEVDVGLNVAIGSEGSRFVRYTDASGTEVTLRLTGGQGNLLLMGTDLEELAHGAGAFITGEDVTLAELTLSDTTSRDTLIIVGGGGDGVIEIGSIDGKGSLGGLIGPKVGLTGEGLTFDGPIERVLLHEDIGPSTLTGPGHGPPTGNSGVPGLQRVDALSTAITSAAGRSVSPTYANNVHSFTASPWDQQFAASSAMIGHPIRSGIQQLADLDEEDENARVVAVVR